VTADFFEMNEVLQAAQDLQQQMLDAQERLGASRLEAQAANGRVKVIVSGVGDLLSLDLAPEIMTSMDSESLSAAIMDAVQSASDSAIELQQKIMGPLTKGFGGMAG
jgi:hypothetical protein